MLATDKVQFREPRLFVAALTFSPRARRASSFVLRTSYFVFHSTFEEAKRVFEWIGLLF